MGMQSRTVCGTCVLPQGAMDSWRATREWVTCESQPDIDTIERVAGRDAPVTVTDTSQQVRSHHCSYVHARGPH